MDFRLKFQKSDFIGWVSSYTFSYPSNSQPKIYLILYCEIAVETTPQNWIPWYDNSLVDEYIGRIDINISYNFLLVFGTASVAGDKVMVKRHGKIQRKFNRRLKVLTSRKKLSIDASISKHG